MTTTPSNYQPSEVRTALWLRHPRLFAFLDRVDSGDGYTADHDLLAYIHCQNDWPITEAMIADAEPELEGWLAPNEPAFPLDVRDIPNGTFRISTVDEDGDAIDQFDYQIYTVTRGRWAGRRVIKFKAGRTDSFKAFAFINADGTWTLWSRFRSEANEPYILNVPLLLQAITQQYQNFRGRVIDGDEWNLPHDDEYMTWRLILVNMHCRICNAGIDREQGFLTQLCYNHAPSESRGLLAEIRSQGGVPRSDGRTDIVHPERRVPLSMCEVTQEFVQ